MSHIYQIIQCDPSPCFASFADTVSDARREGDVHPDKTIIADTMKLMGNSAYGKCATEKTRHRDVVFCNEEVASRGINSHRFRQLEPVAESVYQLTLSQKSIKFDLPLQIALMVYQYAKLRMPQFYYDFLDFNKRTPGLFKVEWEGKGFVGLCSKTYYCFGDKDKFSTKGLNKRNNEIDKEVFLNVLKSRKNGVGTNRGFRTVHGSIFTYVQERSALSYFYGKRRVQPDGVSTSPCLI